MRYFIFLVMLLFSFFNGNSQESQESIYDIFINDIDGIPINLSAFKGKFILFVNVASECGFTKQYAGLEELHNLYSDNLIVVGLPCNQFGNQEPGNTNEIKAFCVDNYGVSFLLTEKVYVKGDGQHPLYLWLTDKRLNGSFSSSVKWNFQKYLVGPNGDLLNYFLSTTRPMSSKITSILMQ